MNFFFFFLHIVSPQGYCEGRIISQSGINDAVKPSVTCTSADVDRHPSGYVLFALVLHLRFGRDAHIDALRSVFSPFY